MKSVHWKPVFRYQMRDFLLGALPFFGVMAAIMMAVAIFGNFTGGTGYVTFSGYGMASSICLFVIGVVSPRPNLRLSIQFGVSRRTAFFAQLAAAVAAIAALAVAGELLLATLQTGNNPSRVYFADLYQMLYCQEGKTVLSLQEHLTSLCFNMGLMLACFAFGMFFTSLFWRLNKVFTVVAALCIPVVLNVVPWILAWIGYHNPAVAALGNRLMELWLGSPWSVVCAWLLVAVIFFGISFLLFRGANIREPASK